MPLQEYFERAYKYKELKENEIPLDDFERKEVMKRGAIWHHGPNGEEYPAVWKSKLNSGTVVYVTNTHRATAIRPTLHSAISAYHKYIKQTA